MTSEITIWIAVWCAFALACGGLIKGALGVGTPLLTVPLMALVLPPQSAIVIMAIPVVVANFWQVSQASRSGNIVRRFWPVFIAVLAGTWIGVNILAGIDEQKLLIFVGIAVIVFTLFQGLGNRLQIPTVLEIPAGLGFGFASGVIGGISSFFGPMLIIYLVSLQSLSKDQFVGSISYLYIGAVVPWVLALYYVGVLDRQLLLYSAAAAVPVVLGMIVGRKLRDRISEYHFHKLVLVILLCSGAAILWRAIG